MICNFNDDENGVSIEVSDKVSDEPEMISNIRERILEIVSGIKDTDEIEHSHDCDEDCSDDHVFDKSQTSKKAKVTLKIEEENGEISLFAESDPSFEQDYENLSIAQKVVSQIIAILHEEFFNEEDCSMEIKIDPKG